MKVMRTSGLWCLWEMCGGVMSYSLLLIPYFLIILADICSGGGGESAVSVRLSQPTGAPRTPLPLRVPKTATGATFALGASAFGSLRAGLGIGVGVGVGVGHYLGPPPSCRVSPSRCGLSKCRLSHAS